MIGIRIEMGQIPSYYLDINDPHPTNNNEAAHPLLYMSIFIIYIPSRHRDCPENPARDISKVMNSIPND